MSVDAAPTRALVLALLLATGVCRATTIISNGDFATGDLSNWTPFTTLNGTNGSALPQVVNFAVGGSTVTAAQFHVGQATPTTNTDWEGGGLTQNIQLGTGTLHFSAKLFFTSASDDISAGTARILLNDNVVASYTYGMIGAGRVLQSSISYTAAVNSGSYTLGVQFVRPAASGASSPFQYITGIYAYQDYNYFGASAVPEPSSFLLLLAGGALILAKRRRTTS